MWRFLKKLHRIVTYDTAILLPKDLKTGIKTNAYYANVHSGTIHSTQKVETTPISPISATDEWIKYAKYFYFILYISWNVQSFFFFSPFCTQITGNCHSLQHCNKFPLLRGITPFFKKMNSTCLYSFNTFVHHEIRQLSFWQ